MVSIDGEAFHEPAACVDRLALERQHIKCQGRTPEATMASALYTDVKRKGNKSVFTRCIPISPQTFYWTAVLASGNWLHASGFTHMTVPPGTYAMLLLRASVSYVRCEASLPGSVP